MNTKRKSFSIKAYYLRKLIIPIITLAAICGSVFGVNEIIKHQQFASASPAPTIRFTEQGIESNAETDDYTIDGTALKIEAAGTYKITGTCTSDCHIETKKGLKNVTLLLENLNLAATSTAPLVVKGEEAEVTVELAGTSTLADNEQDDTLESYEGAAIKVKKTSRLTLTGDGVLNLSSNKNGIKGAEDATIVIENGKYNITAANDGIASDGAITINGGIFDIDVDGDGISAYSAVNITNGVFDIKTRYGYNSPVCTHNDTTSDLSCKGIKVSQQIDGELNISGGEFEINAADDGLNSNGNMSIAAGTLTIRSGDDGMHSNFVLTIGTEDGFERDPEITIKKGYEGMEAEHVYLYSGRINIQSTDDGINSVGAYSEPTPDENPHIPGDHSCRYEAEMGIWIYGGKIYINAGGDGLDSNGDIIILGGEMEIWSMRVGGTSGSDAIDVNACLAIHDATVFASGDRGVEFPHDALNSNTNQGYVYTTDYFASGRVINVTGNTREMEVIYSAKAPKNVNYTFFTSPEVGPGSTIESNSTTLDICKANSWEQTWTETVIREATEEHSGLTNYTNSSCTGYGAERKTTFYQREISGETVPDEDEPIDDGEDADDVDDDDDIIVPKTGMFGNDGSSYARLEVIVVITMTIVLVGVRFGIARARRNDKKRTFDKK